MKARRSGAVLAYPTSARRDRRENKPSGQVDSSQVEPFGGRMPSRKRRPSTEDRPKEIRYPFGKPGFRNRPGRSGLDPMDTYREEGSVIGSLIRALIRVQVRPRNPLWIVLLLLLGSLLLGSIILDFMIPPGTDPVGLVCGLAPFQLLGFILVVNAVASIWGIIASRSTKHKPKHTE